MLCSVEIKTFQNILAAYHRSDASVSAASIGIANTAIDVRDFAALRKSER